MKLRKRKYREYNDKAEELTDSDYDEEEENNYFTDSDGDVSDDGILNEVGSYVRPKTSSNNPKLELVKNKIKERSIGYNEIMKLDLPEDELIWFVEYIQILKNIPKYTEDHYRIKNLIYNRYKNLEKNLDRNARNKETLNKLRDIGNIQTDILTRICECNHSEYVKSILYKKYLLMSDLDKSDEYFKHLDWIDTVLDLPTEIKLDGKSEPINDMLVKLRDQLNEKIYGLDNVKERIIEAYCAMLTNPTYKKKIIALMGPPGTGKTALGASIAEAFNQTFSQISFGGIKDPQILTGFSMTYIGSRPGEFVNKLRRAKVLNTVILLDEIDKIPDTVEGHSISSVLLHALDKTQNDHFQDMYMPEIPVNLSHVFFILAMNDDSLIDPILKDRLYIIKIDGYSLDEKIIIGKDYIFPKVLTELNFKKEDIIIDDATMKYIIQRNNVNGEIEKGVRNLEKDITTICEKINVLKNTCINKNKKSKKIKLSYAIDGLSFPITVTKYIVNTLLDQ